MGSPFASKASDAAFKQSLADSCLYYDQGIKEITVLRVYLDDILITGTSFSSIESTFDSLSSLSIKNIGPVSKFLSMRLRYSDEDGYYLDQELSICELITKVGMDEAHPVLTPIGDDYSDSTTSNSDLLEMRSVKKPTIKKFLSLAGSLLWFARCTRPDISFAIHKLMRRTHAPTTADWALGVRVVKYLKGTKTMKLYLGGEVCTDAREVTLEAFFRC